MLDVFLIFVSLIVGFSFGFIVGYYANDCEEFWDYEDDVEEEDEEDMGYIR